jgi:hypothetical protein
VSDVPILHLDGEPIRVKSGPLTNGDKARIERAVGLAVPEGKQFVAIGVLDKKTGEPLAGRVGAAWRTKDGRWKLATEVEALWGGPVTGTIGVVFSR